MYLFLIAVTIPIQINISEAVHDRKRVCITYLLSKFFAMKHRKSDILWKDVLEGVIADLLRFLYDDADKVYNMERGFEFLDKELSEQEPQPDEGKDSRFVDKLVKVYHLDGIEEWVLLHIEVQGDTTYRDVFADRMFTYFCRIRDRHPGKLISGLAIFTGLDGQNMPGEFVYRYRGTEVTYKYPTLAVTAFDEQELQNSTNPFAQVIIAVKMRLLEGKVTEDRLLDIKLLAARRLEDKGFPPAVFRAIFKFLRNYVLFEKSETSRKFDDEYRVTDKYNIMNTLDIIKEEGEIVGREKAAVIFVQNLLRQSDFSVEKIAAVASVSVEFVNEIKKNLNGKH